MFVDSTISVEYCNTIDLLSCFDSVCHDNTDKRNTFQCGASQSKHIHKVCHLIFDQLENLGYYFQYHDSNYNMPKHPS